MDIHFTETKDTLKIEIMDNGGIKETAPTSGKGVYAGTLVMLNDQEGPDYTSPPLFPTV